MPQTHGADRPRSVGFPSFAPPVTVDLAMFVAFAKVACSGSGSPSDHQADAPPRCGFDLDAVVGIHRAP